MTLFARFASRHAVVLLLLALLAVTTLVYWPGLSGEWLFDDYPNIVTNHLVQPAALTWEALSAAARGYQPGPIGRPLATLWFAMDYLIGGKNPWVFKASGLVAHLLNAALVFWLLRRLLALPRAQANATWTTPAIFTIALLWAIHPLQVSTVLYVVQRMETLSLTFVLLALIAYLRGRLAQRDGQRGWPWLAGSGVLAALGLLAKETAVLFPLYTLVLELTVLGFDASTPRTQRFIRVAYAGAVVFALALFLFWVLPQYAAAGAYGGRDFTVSERLLTQLRVLPMYLGQMLLPLPGSMPFYYDSYPKSTGWLDPMTTLASAVLLAAFLAMAWGVRKRMPLVALGIGWFFAAHALTSNVINLELVFEHRNYFALLGILIAVADLVRRFPMRDGPALKYVAVTVMVLGFGMLAVLRSATWGNPMHLAMDLVAKNPTSSRASNDMATFYVGMSDSNPNSPFYSFGAQEFERGSRLPGASPLAEQGLILMAAATGQPVKSEWWDRLIHKVKTRPISPQEMMAVNGLMQQRYAGIVLDDHRLSEAYAALLSRGPMPPQMYARYGDFALTYLHDELLADRMFTEAVNHGRTDPGYPEKIASSLLAEGRVRQATVVLEHARTLGLVQPSGVRSPGSLAP